MSKQVVETDLWPLPIESAGCPIQRGRDALWWAGSVKDGDGNLGRVFAAGVGQLQRVAPSLALNNVIESQFTITKQGKKNVNA